RHCQVVNPVDRIAHLTVQRQSFWTLHDRRLLKERRSKSSPLNRRKTVWFQAAKTSFRLQMVLGSGGRPSTGIGQVHCCPKIPVGLLQQPLRDRQVTAL